MRALASVHHDALTSRNASNTVMRYPLSPARQRLRQSGAVKTCPPPQWPLSSQVRLHLLPDDWLEQLRTHLPLRHAGNPPLQHAGHIILGRPWKRLHKERLCSGDKRELIGLSASFYEGIVHCVTL